MKKILVSCACVMLASSANAIVVAYTGANGNWSTAGNWTPAAVPTADDDVVINENKQVSLDDVAEVKSLRVMNGAILSVAGTAATVPTRLPKDAARTDPVGLTVSENVLVYGSLAIGGVNQICPSQLTVGGDLMVSNALGNAMLVVYAGIGGAYGEVATYKTGGASVTVAGRTVVGGAHATNTSIIYPYCNVTNGAPVIFNLQDIVVTPLGRFDATGRGFGKVSNVFYGPGQGRAAGGGGGYGGFGGGTTTSNYGLTYGYELAPYMPGSPGRDCEEFSSNWNGAGVGGGALRIRARDVVLDGQLLANGRDYYGTGNRGGGSGGSVFVTCSNFTAGATASVQAKGGNFTDHVSYLSAAGGGGRIAIVVGGPTASQIDSLYATGSADGLMSMPFAEGPHPALASVDRGINAFRTANGLTPNYNGEPGTAFWVVNLDGDNPVEVTGDPVETDGATPPFGKNKIPAGALTASVVSPGHVSGSGGLSRMTCAGHTWSNLTDSASGPGASVAIDVDEPTWIIWTWTNLEHKVTARSGGYGTVAAHDDWHEAGSTCQLTAVPDAGCTFLHWVGDVPFADRTNATVTLTMDEPKTLTACFAGPSGRALSANASAGGDWFDPATWDGVAIPGPADSVSISGVDVRIAQPSEVAVGALTLASSAFLHVGGTGADLLAQTPASTDPERPFSLAVAGALTLKDSAKLALGGLDTTNRALLSVGGDLWVTNTAAIAAYAGFGSVPADLGTYTNGGAVVSVAGATTLASGTWIHVFCNRLSGAPVLFNLADLDVAATAGFNASGRGHSVLGVDYRFAGPGTATSYDGNGGSHGGKGGGGQSKPPYGFAYAPYQPGSAGKRSSASLGMGGGSIRISAENVNLAGQLLAKGQSNGGVGNAAGSGGSVWVACETFTAAETAKIDAEGGPATQHSSCGAGGGGRVAIMTASPTPAQIESLYLTGTCDKLIVVTTNLNDAATSPYPTLATVLGGVNSDKKSDPACISHGKPGTAVWLQNRGDNQQVVVSGVPDWYGEATPPYGNNALPGGATTFSVVSPAMVPGSADRTRVFCQGYVWSNAVQSASGSGASIQIDLTADTWVEWTWGGVQHRIDTASGGYGTVQQNFAEWQDDGADCVLTAVPDDGCTFLYWAGDVPEADRFDAVLTLTMDKPRAVTACFAGPAPRTLTAAGGDWFNIATWDGVAIPGPADSVSIASATVDVGLPGPVSVGTLALSGTGFLRVGGTGADALAQTPIATAPECGFGLVVHGELQIGDSAKLSLGGAPADYRTDLTVQGGLTLTNSGLLAVYAGGTGAIGDLETYRVGGATVAVSGVTRLGSGAWIHPICNPVNGTPVIFALHNVFVATNAGFNATGRGNGGYLEPPPPVYYGLGAPATGGSGGSYGGRGGGAGPAPYGHACAPYHAGSPGRNLKTGFGWGGGALRIDAERFELAGKLLADGKSNENDGNGAGSGGSIWLTCRRFIPDVDAGARVSAAGGWATQHGTCGAGGGGRVCIITGDPSDERIAGLYDTGDPGRLVVVSDDLTDPAASPYPGLVNVSGGMNTENQSNPDYDKHGDPGTAVLLDAGPKETVLVIR